jgi:glycosyltransferase involved in cell wall biosynthesis
MITIIIPSFNRATLIGSTIDSIINQGYAKWELLIVDDGSTDNTEDIVADFVRKDSRIKFLQRGKTQVKGANTCRNIGLTFAQGEYIKWVDSDDLLAPDCLEKQLMELQVSNADVCFSQTNYFKEINGNIAYLDKLWCRRLRPDDLTYNLVMGKLRFHIMSGLWKRASLPVKPFREGLMNSQEWLFHIEMSLNKKLSYSFVDEVLFHARVHNNSMSNKSNKGGRYYFNEAYARMMAIMLIGEHRPPNCQAVIIFLMRKFVWFQLFTIYNGNIMGFFRLSGYYPRLLRCLWK